MISTPRAGIEMQATQSENNVLARKVSGSKYSIEVSLPHERNTNLEPYAPAVATQLQGQPRSFRSPERGDVSSREVLLEEQPAKHVDGIVVSRHSIETAVAWILVGLLLAAGGFGFQ